jgi:hypothetical protein
MKDYYAYIDDYLKENLSEQDLSDFEAEMAANPQLRQAVEDYDVAEIVLDGLLEDELRQAVEGATRNVANVVGKDSTPVAKRPLLALAAVTLFLLVVSALLYKYLSEESSTRQNTYASAIKPVTKGSTTKDIQAAFARYSSDTIATIQALEVIGNLESAYWLAEIAADRQRWAEVISTVPPIDSLSTIKRDRSVYILAYAYYDTGQPSSIDSLLSIYGDKIDPYYTEALKSLSKK